MAGHTGKRAVAPRDCTICRKPITGDFLRVAKNDDRHTGCEYPSGPNAPGRSATEPIELTPWDEELVTHPSSGVRFGPTTFECRALIQARDQYGNPWRGEKIILIKMQRDTD